MYSSKRIIKALRWLIAGNKAERRRVRHEMARIISHLLGGFIVSDDHKMWINDSEFVNNCKRLSPGNYYSQERKFMLKEWTRYVMDLDGSMAECGSYEGASAFFIARELPDVPLHLFDSFEGLSRPSGLDQPLSDDQLPWKEGALSSMVEILEKNLDGFRNIQIHKGWIPDCFHEVSGEKFRFLHIDVDLHQPTYDSLEFFYPRMVAGGVIVMDDYGFENCQGAYNAANVFMQGKPEIIVHAPTGQGIIIKK